MLIPKKNHYTLYISNQIKYTQNYTFYLTTQNKFIRNLTNNKILAQIKNIQNKLPNPIPLTNIIFIKIKKPLTNYHNLLHTIKIITNKSTKFGFSNHQITISTTNLIPKITTLEHNTKVNLTMSLNTTNNQIHNILIPINQTYPIKNLLTTYQNYPLPTNQQITFKYILITKINESITDTKRLTHLLQPIQSKINLIPFNKHKNYQFKQPTKSIILQFQQVLIKKNYTTIIHTNKNQNISTTYKQLKTKTIKINK